MAERDDIQIELGESVRRHIESRRSPLKDGAYAVAAFGSPNEDRTPVFISETAMRAIERHAAAQKEREIGGVLLGGFYRSDDGSFVEVTDVIEAKAAKGTDISLTFTHETWEQINAEHASRAPDSQIVGWYHSHPGLGVFMSKEDEFIHSSFFADPWHVAIVVDPIYHNWGCFKWSDGSLERTGGFYISADRKAGKRLKEYVKKLTEAKLPTPRTASASADRAAGTGPGIFALWALVAVLLVSQIVLAGLVSSTRSLVKQGQEYRHRAEQLLRKSDLSGAMPYLHAELARRPANREALQEMRRLDAVLSSETVRSFENDRLDRINLMLDTAGDLARPGEETDDDPTKVYADACKTYKENAGTRETRLRRALAIQRIASGGKKRIRSQWYDDAVRWLRGERIREIAYGLAGGVDGYDSAYKNLSKKDKKAVGRLAGILKESAKQR